MSDVTSIPGVTTVHSRSSWQDPKWPVVGPAANQAAIDAGVIHYTAAAKIPGDLFAFHRSMQYAYAKPKSEGGRGYSLGYRWSVVSGGPRDGEVFQIRGWDLKSAANAGHNDHTEPILVLVDGNDAATPLAVQSVRAIIAESQRRSGRTFAITGHGQLDGASTSCPGVGLRAQIAAGVFTPQPTPPPPPPPPGDDDMPLTAYIVQPPTERTGSPWLVVCDGDIRPATTFDVTDGKMPIRQLTDQYRVEQYDMARKHAGV